MERGRKEEEGGRMKEERRLSGQSNNTMPSSRISHLNPNSRRTFSGPATSLILAAFVAIREGKFTRFNRVVSKS